MAPTSNEFGTVSSFLNTSLLQAIREAGSYVPSGPASRLADKLLGYNINEDVETSSYFSFAENGEPEPPAAPNPADKRVELLVSHLLAWPQAAAADHTNMVTIGLPLAMKCLGQHMAYDPKKHRVRLKADSEVRLRGAELGLPEEYLGWLCADEDARATNILRIGVRELKLGEEILSKVWKGVGG